MSGETIRLQKYLAERGVASRRSSADLVRAGRVTVNGTTTKEPGVRVIPGDDVICVDEKELSHNREQPRSILLYKPRGYICSRSSKQGKTVFELLQDIPERLVPVGRLDKDSEGLLLLSNDGELVDRLTHPRYGQRKTYHVTVSGDTGKATLRRLNQPFELDGYRTRPAKVRVLRHASRGDDRVILAIVLKEGRNRQIREMCRQVKLRVHRLVRVAIGDLTAPRLKPGAWRDVAASELSVVDI